MYAFARHVFLGKKAPDNIYSDFKKIAEKTVADKQAGRPVTIPEKYKWQNRLSWRRVRKEIAKAIFFSMILGICAFVMAMLGLKFFPQQTKIFMGITRASEFIFVYPEDGLENQLALENIAKENSLEAVSFSVLKENIRGDENYYGTLILEINQDDKESLTYLLALKVFF